MSARPEVWLPVIGFAGRYDVSNHGRVRNGQSGLILTPSTNRGYSQVDLYSAPGCSKTHYIHATVLRAFCGPPPFPGAEACHNDGDRSNNSLTNLRWGSRQDNASDRGRHGRTRFGTGQRCAKLSDDAVRQLRADYRAGKSTHVLARELNLSTNTVWCAVTGKTWSHVEGAIENGGQ